MTRGRILRVGLLAVMCLCAATVQAATWGEWLAPAEAPRLVAEFLPGWEIVEKEFEKSSAHDFIPRNTVFDGFLSFELPPGASPPEGPLTIRFSFSTVSPDELNWPPEDRSFTSDFELMVLPQAVPAAAATEHTWTLPAEFPLQVPVVYPQQCDLPRSAASRRPFVVFGRYEVRDASGREWCRGFFPARNRSGSMGSLTGLPDSKEALLQSESDIGDVTRVSDLPDEMAAYPVVKGIWFTENLWAKLQGREALLRRLLLSGFGFYGEAELLGRMGATLGVGTNGWVLGTTLSSEPWRNISSRSRFSFRDTRVRKDYNRNKSAYWESLFENDTGLFAADMNASLIWTLVSTLVFCVGVAAILGVVLIRFRGERRVVIWWALPSWAVLCSILIWASGIVFLERRPRADVTEYRLVKTDWPEMYCHAVADAMTFQSGRPTWRLPPTAVLNARGSGLDGWWKREDVHSSPDEILLQLPQKTPGEILSVEAGWFEETAMPMELEKGTGEGAERSLVATEDLDGVFVFIAGEWHELGPMKAGDRHDPTAAPARGEHFLPGLPNTFTALLPHKPSDPCTNPEHGHPPPDLTAPKKVIKHDWVIVAWQRATEPRVVPLWEDALIKSRTIWIIQWP